MADSKLVFTGCGDAFGSGGRLNTCFYVETPDTHFLIDCGASVLPGLKKQGISPNDIDTIMITHFHGDHYGGIPFFLIDAASNGRKKSLTIITPPGGEDRITALLDLLYPGMEPLEKLEVRFLDYHAGEKLETNHVSLLAYPVIHSEGSLPHGLRITTGNKIISYSGDTSWTDALLELSGDADLFICECDFFTTRIKGHMNYMDLKAKLADLNCKRKVLTHFDKEMLQHLEEVNIECAYDGMEIII